MEMGDRNLQTAQDPGVLMAQILEVPVTGDPGWAGADADQEAAVSQSLCPGYRPRAQGREQQSFQDNHTKYRPKMESGTGLPGHHHRPGLWPAWSLCGVEEINSIWRLVGGSFPGIEMAGQRSPRIRSKR